MTSAFASGMQLLSNLWIPGDPKTKGSMTFKGGGYVEENVVGSVRWRMFIVERARAARLQPEPWAGPCEVVAMFFLCSPTSHNADAYATWPRAGDLDKLTRNLLDALSVNRDEPKKGAGIYVDDNQVISAYVRKVPAFMSSWGSSGLQVSVTGLGLTRSEG